MDELWDTAIVGITAVAVTVIGQWNSALTGWDPTQGATWVGQATAPEPLVAIQLVCTPQYYQGVKSAKYAPAGTEYTMLPLAIVLHAVGQPGHPQGQLRQQVTLAVTRPVHVTSVGGWVQHPASVALQLQAHSIPFQIQTGRWTALIRTPDVSLGVVFLARRDVRYARKAIWNLRSRYRDGQKTHAFEPLFAFQRTQTIMHRYDDHENGM